MSIFSARQRFAVIDELETFLDGKVPGATESALWGNGTIPLRIEAHLGVAEPPLQYVTSVRALVLDEQTVLVFWDDGDRPQLLPGGRREGNESLLQTLHREVLEETGIEPLDPALLGFLRYHHLGPMPSNYTFPYPDFIQPVFLARPGAERPDARIHDPHVTRSALCPLEAVEKLPLRTVDRLFFAAAYGSRA